MDQIAITGWGESLHGRTAWDLMRLAREAGVSISVTTNGTLLTPANRRRLIDEGVGFVSVSFDAGTEDGYRRLRPGGIPLAKMADNVRALIELRDELKRPTPLIGANFVLHEDSACELVPLLHLLHAIGVRRLCVQSEFLTDFPEEGPTYFLSPQALQAVAAGDAAALELGIEIDRHLPMMLDLSTGKLEGLGQIFHFLPSREQVRSLGLVPTCRNPWESPFMNKEGKLFPCNFYPEPMGDAAAEGYEKAWDSAAFRDFRRNMQSGEPSDACLRCRFTTWYAPEEDRPIAPILRMDASRLEGLGFYPLERPANAAPFRWGRGICDFYLKNEGDARLLFLEGRTLVEGAPIDVEINGSSCGVLRGSTRWKLMTLPLPELKNEILHITLRSRTAQRDPATPLQWERRRLLGVALTQAGLCATQADIVPLMPHPQLPIRAWNWARRMLNAAV